MRRLDIFGICLLVLLGGGGAYGLFQTTGLAPEQAGILASTGLAGILVIWIFTYLRRVMTGTMALREQNEAYQIAALQDQLDQLSPEELAAVEERYQQSLATPDDPQ